MAMFGNRRRPLFGAEMLGDVPYGTPPINGNPAHQLPSDAGTPWPMPREPIMSPGAEGGTITPAPAEAFTPRKRSTLDKIGILADAFRGTRTNQDALQAVDDRDYAAWQQQQQYQRARIDKFADFTREYDYRVKNPMPSTAQPYRWEGNDGDVYELGADGKPRRLFDDPTPRYVPDGVGGLAMIPGTGAASSAPVGTVRPVGKLTPIGGAGSMAPSTFR